MDTESKSSNLSIREEFRHWFHATPRVWLVVGLIALVAFVLGCLFGAIAMTMFFF